jgi:hypothetical protein
VISTSAASACALTSFARSFTRSLVNSDASLTATANAVFVRLLILLTKIQNAYLDPDVGILIIWWRLWSQPRPIEKQRDSNYADNNCTSPDYVWRAKEPDSYLHLLSNYLYD